MTKRHALPTTDEYHRLYWPVEDVRPGWGARVELDHEKGTVSLLGIPSDIDIKHAPEVAEAILAAVAYYQAGENA